MKIVLVGYMGSGKSTIGKEVAAKLGYDFLDLDDHIEGTLGMTVSDVFRKKGELFFRKKEHQLLTEVLRQERNLVLSTGGGTPCYSDNMASMLELSDAVFYLKVPIPELVERLSKEKAHRPLIRQISNADLPGFIGKHLFERNVFYSQASHTVDCNQKGIDVTVKEIIAALH